MYPLKEGELSNNDPFELKVSISRLERYRTGSFCVFLAGLLAANYFWPQDGTDAGQIIISAVIIVGHFVHREIIENRLDVLRSSLRAILIKKNPSVLDDPDW